MIGRLISDKNTFKTADPAVQSRITYPIPDWLKVDGSCTPPVYEQIWNSVRESDTSQYCDIRMVSHLFNTSHLSIETLGYLWYVGNLKSPSSLSQQELYIILALIALVQNNYMVNDISVLLELDGPIVPKLNYSMLHNRYAEPKEVLKTNCTKKMNNLRDNGLNTSCENYESLSLNFLGTTDQKIKTYRKTPSSSQQQLRQLPQEQFGSGQQQKFTSHHQQFTSSRQQQSRQQSETSNVNDKLVKLNARHRRVRQIVNKIRYKLPPIVEINTPGSNNLSSLEYYDSASNAFNRSTLVNGTVKPPNVVKATASVRNCVHSDDLYSVSFAGPSKYVNTHSDIQTFPHCTFSTGNSSKFRPCVQNNIDLMRSSVTGGAENSINSLTTSTGLLHTLDFGKLGNNVKIESLASSEDEEDEFTEFQSAVFHPDDEYTDFQSAVPIQRLENNIFGKANTDHFVLSTCEDSNINTQLTIYESNNCVPDNKYDTTDILKSAFQEDNIASFTSVFDSPKDVIYNKSTSNDICSLSSNVPIKSDSSSFEQFEKASCCFDIVKNEQFDLNLLSDTCKHVSSDFADNETISSMSIADEQKLEDDLSEMKIVEGVCQSSMVDDQDIKSLQLDPVSDVCLPPEDKYGALRMLEAENIMPNYTDNNTDIDSYVEDDDDFGDFVAAAADVHNEETESMKPNNTSQIKCLNACIRLLEEGVVVFHDVENKFEDENALKNVLTDDRCCRYSNQLKIVYETSQRLRTHFGTPDINSRLDEAWSVVSKYVQRNASTERLMTEKDAEVVDHGSNICNICQTECFSKHIAHVGAVAYHPSCINLFLHFVEDANMTDVLQKQTNN